MAASANAGWLRAQQHLAGNRLVAARNELEALLDQAPAFVPARILMAGIELSFDRLRSASAQLLHAADNLAPDPDLICRVVQALLRVGEVNAARACLLHPAIASCRNGRTLATIAHTWQMIGDHPAALAMMDRARDTGFRNGEFLYYRAVQLQFNGRLDEAGLELDSALQLNPGLGRAALTRARLKRQTPEANHLEQIRQQITRAIPGSEDQAAFEFAQYKELEDLREFDAAWQALERGNRLMYARFKHDPQREERLLDRLIAATPPSFLESETPAAHAPGPVPIFIMGLPRSGTTLLDRILGNHSDVSSAGELGDFARQLRWVADHPGHALLDETLLGRLPALDFRAVGARYLEQTQWRARGKGFYVDKLPPNYLLAGLIAKSLPQARLLHISRDPMDVCFSNWRALFGEAYPYSYDLAVLAQHHRQYRRIMRHWDVAMPGRILDVDYARLVEDAESVAAEVFQFCGLQLEAGCTDTTRNDAPSATLSSVQVREPIDRRGLRAWAPYAAQLEPLRASLLD